MRGRCAALPLVSVRPAGPRGFSGRGERLLRAPALRLITTVPFPSGVARAGAAWQRAAASSSRGAAASSLLTSTRRATTMASSAGGVGAEKLRLGAYCRPVSSRTVLDALAAHSFFHARAQNTAHAL